MPGRVRVLDEATVNKIAAGEVVERPASVVKELIENSIDAKATRISILIEEGGIRSISVTDDGEGMDREDALLALERHATSKIEGVDDIFSIATLGFRGEALPSIAAVSRFVMVTRTAKSPGGTRIVSEGGKKPAASDHPSAPGTSVAVNDLFYNTPARRKYLRQPSTEARRVIEAVTGEALGHPEIAFSLESGGRRVLSTSGSDDLLQTLGEVMGLELARSLVEFGGGTPDVAVRGYVSNPSIARSNRRGLVFIVNGRPVVSGLLAAAVTRAYGQAMPKGRYPVGVVVITTDPRQVDVNVHPAKTEVRFAEEQTLFRLISRTVASAVGSHEIARPSTSSSRYGRVSATLPARTSPGERTNKRAGELFAADGPMVVTAMEGARASAGPLQSRQSYASPGSLTGTSMEYTVIGQLWDSYVVVSSDDALLLIDQHAAMERLLYDKLMNELLSSGLSSQEVLMPDTVILSASEAEAVEENQAALRRLGFRLEPFGMRAYLVRAVPAVLDGDESEDALRDVLAAVCDDSSSPSPDDLSSDLVDGVCAGLACRAALKANHRLSRDEMTRLVDDLLSKATSLRCPHGRPVVISYPKGDIEKRLGRR